MVVTAPVSAAVCTNPQGNHFVDFRVPDIQSGFCYHGTGNINGDNNDGFLALALSPNYAAVTNGVVVDKVAGTWSIVDALVVGLENFVLGLKQGNGWAAFILEPGILSGTYETRQTNGQALWGTDLSHAQLYATVAAVPVPAGLPLLGAGLAILGAVGWRRRKASVQA